MCVAALLALQSQWESDRREREEEEARQRRKIENNPVPSLTACPQNEFYTTAANSIPFSSFQQTYIPPSVQEETKMFLRNEILEIQHDEQQKVNAENTEVFKHIVECIDADLRRFAKENPNATERVYRVQSFEFTVSENKIDYLPGELGYVKVSNLHFKALKEHYENEHFTCSGTYDRSYGNGEFIISWA
jgi:hypothetical protein